MLRKYRTWENVKILEPDAFFQSVGCIVLKEQLLTQCFKHTGKREHYSSPLFKRCTEPPIPAPLPKHKFNLLKSSALFRLQKDHTKHPITKKQLFAGLHERNQQFCCEWTKCSLLTFLLVEKYWFKTSGDRTNTKGYLSIPDLRLFSAPCVTE